MGALERGKFASMQEDMVPATLLAGKLGEARGVFKEINR